MKIQYGKVTINIHAPKISEEENQKRRDEVTRIASIMCKERLKRGEF